MSRAFKRRLRHAAEDPLPDMSGWTPYERLLWAAENGKYEELVRKARESQPPPRMTTPEENEAALQADGKWPPPEPVAERKAPAVEPPTPSEPKPEPPWWEEKARWRARGAADYDWADGPRYECLHEYDPLGEDE